MRLTHQEVEALLGRIGGTDLVDPRLLERDPQLFLSAVQAADHPEPIRTGWTGRYSTEDLFGK